MDPTTENLSRAVEDRGLAMTIQEAVRLSRYVGRMPTALEFHLFDTMWSEHCSYKSSRPVLGLLPTSAPQVVIGPGEDAGVVRFCTHQGVEWDLVVAHESHNHPSQVLPVEGAATGIGGIVRDVYCMGARVTGSMDLLRFGDPLGAAGEKTRAICRGVVEGIWKYGNALGVPNMGGDTRFHPGFDENCLVNVVAAGFVRHDRIVHSFVPDRAHDEEYVFILVGKATDDTGFGGATFASADLEEETGKGAVQVADPFLKRVLSEANARVMEVLWKSEIPFGFKDLGAGGLACVSSELAAHGGLGIEVDLDAVPVSIPGLPPEVIACAETQERYGLAVPATAVEEVLRIYNEDFQLPLLFTGAGATVVGRFNSEMTYRVTYRGVVVADAPIDSITEGVVYERGSKPIEADAVEPESRPFDPGADIARMLTSIDGASRSPVWSYYDSEVQGATHFRPGEADSCVSVPIPGCRAGLAVSGDGNPWYGQLDPFLAGAHAVGEAVRNVVSVGAVPIAATDCLNYGNPEKPGVFWQFRRGVEGIAEACVNLGLAGDGDHPLPIVSGNVSFYNQSSSGGSIPPSPIVAVFGKLDDFTLATDLSLKNPGDLLVLVGERVDEMGGSLYYRTCLRHFTGRIPEFRGVLERKMAEFVLGCCRSGTAVAVHDISEGGLSVCAVEMALGSRCDSRRGVLFKSAVSGPVQLCSETPGYLLEMSPRDWEGVTSKPSFTSVVGRVTDRFSIEGAGWELPLESIRESRETLLDRVIWREEVPE